MGKRFRTDHLDQRLLPPSLHDWLPEGHLARFVADVVKELDLGAVYRSYEGDGRGLAAYQPSMIVRGYCQGVVSSRKMEKATQRLKPVTVSQMCRGRQGALMRRNRPSWVRRPAISA
jgi:hypothetical protein